MCFMCINVILLVPHGRLNGNIFKMRNIWWLLIGQFLLPMHVAFCFSFKKPMEIKQMLSLHTCILQQCCTNCHCPLVRSKTVLLFPGLIVPLKRIHVQYAAPYFWIQSVSWILVGVKTHISVGISTFPSRLRPTSYMTGWGCSEKCTIPPFFSIPSVCMPLVSFLPWTCTNRVRWLGCGGREQLISGELLFYTCHV